MTQATDLHARNEVVGYPPAVLEAVHALIHEVRLWPELAAATGTGMDAMKEIFAPAQGDRQSGLYGAIGRLLVVAAEIALEAGESK
jgi:hypothetical protein